MQDEIVSPSELSEWIGVGTSTITDLARRGHIVRAGRGRYRLWESIARYTAHLTAAALDRQDDATGVQRARLLSAQADSATAKAQKLSGAHLDAGEVAREWADIKRRGRAVLMTIPARCKARVPSLTEFDVDVIRQEVELALRPFDDDLQGTAPNNT
jgi:phage terminase Nu1 subunit (DNA packaging protein)